VNILNYLKLMGDKQGKDLFVIGQGRIACCLRSEEGIAGLLENRNIISQSAHCRLGSKRTNPTIWNTGMLLVELSGMTRGNFIRFLYPGMPLNNPLGSIGPLKIRSNPGSSKTSQPTIIALLIKNLHTITIMSNLSLRRSHSTKSHPVN